jgi:ribosomal protein L37AE/L43A
MSEPQIACTGCQGKPVRFRPDIGTWLCDECYADIAPLACHPVEGLSSNE